MPHRHISRQLKSIAAILSAYCDSDAEAASTTLSAWASPSQPMPGQVCLVEIATIRRVRAAMLAVLAERLEHIAERINSGAEISVEDLGADLTGLVQSLLGAELCAPMLHVDAWTEKLPPPK